MHAQKRVLGVYSSLQRRYGELVREEGLVVRDGIHGLIRRAIPSLFATYPRAPEDFAIFTMLALSCMDSRRIPTPGRRLLISRAAVKPSRTGMVMSRITRSG